MWCVRGMCVVGLCVLRVLECMYWGALGVVCVCVCIDTGLRHQNTDTH
jgi:hypothetical protein